MTYLNITIFCCSIKNWKSYVACFSVVMIKSYWAHSPSRTLPYAPMHDQCLRTKMKPGVKQSFSNSLCQLWSWPWWMLNVYWWWCPSLHLLALPRLPFWKGECTLNNSALHFYSSGLAPMPTLNKFFRLPWNTKFWSLKMCSSSFGLLILSIEW